MSLYDLLKRAIGAPEPPPEQPPMARLEIYTTRPIRRSSENQSERARD